MSNEKTKKYPLVVISKSKHDSAKTILLNREPHPIHEEENLAKVWRKFYKLSPDKIWLKVKNFIDQDFQEEEFSYSLATIILIADIEGIGPNQRDYVAKKLLTLGVNLPPYILGDIVLFASDRTVQTIAANKLAAMSQEAPKP